jgi:ribosome recycling factor
MINELFSECKDRMAKTIDHFRQEMASIRTGRASSNMLDHIKVDYYGSVNPLKNIANISIPEGQLILIQPFDPSALEEIEKAISNSDIGLTPNNDGTVIRLNVPPLTEERRLEYVKLVHKLCEDSKVVIRNIRRDINSAFKNQEKDGNFSEDNLKRALENVQETTNENIKILDDIASSKEKEILE